MKDRFRNIERGITLAVGLGVAAAAGGCGLADLSYRDRATKISVTTKNGVAVCYSDIDPENRVYNRGSERWWRLEQFDFACDNAKAIDPTYKTGETIKYLAIGSSLPEPVLTRLK